MFFKDSKRKQEITTDSFTLTKLQDYHFLQPKRTTKKGG